MQKLMSTPFGMLIHENSINKTVLKEIHESMRTKFIVNPLFKKVIAIFNK